MIESESFDFPRAGFTFSISFQPFQGFFICLEFVPQRNCTLLVSSVNQLNPSVLSLQAIVVYNLLHRRLVGYILRREGKPKHTRLGKLGMIRAASTPNIVVIGVEEPDEFGPCGAKGVGEIGLVPTASAVSNAFFQYNGERQYELPLKKMSVRPDAA